MKLYMVFLYGYPVAVCSSINSVGDIKETIIKDEFLNGDDEKCIRIEEIESDVIIQS